jgi:F0F1-type ATP synthase beta subunit
VLMCLGRKSQLGIYPAVPIPSIQSPVSLTIVGRSTTRFILMCKDSTELQGLQDIGITILGMDELSEEGQVDCRAERFKVYESAVHDCAIYWI